MGTINELGEKVNAPIIPADATSLSDSEGLIDQAMEHFGEKLDFVYTPLECQLTCEKENIIPP